MIYSRQRSEYTPQPRATGIYCLPPRNLGLGERNQMQIPFSVATISFNIARHSKSYVSWHSTVASCGLSINPSSLLRTLCSEPGRLPTRAIVIPHFLSRCSPMDESIIHSTISSILNGRCLFICVAGISLLSTCWRKRYLVEPNYNGSGCHIKFYIEEFNPVLPQYLLPSHAH